MNSVIITEATEQMATLPYGIAGTGIEIGILMFSFDKTKTLELQRVEILMNFETIFFLEFPKR